MVQKLQKDRRKKPRTPHRKKANSYLTKSARKGKARTKKPPPRIIDLGNPLDRALALMKAGVTQKTAAKAEGVPEKALRKHRKANTRSKLVHGIWIITDRRAATMLIFADGKIYSIPVGKKAASEIGHYWNAVNQFLETNDISHLKPYLGKSVRDVLGKRHIFETDPNILRRGDSIGDLSFHTLYRNTVV